jgi:DNA polymerase-4
VRPRFAAYREVSRQIRELFHEYTDMVEPLSLDEAFLDVTENKPGIEYASQVAREILQEILQRTRLTASAGVSYNKFLAKIASDVKKPAGLTVVTPAQAAEFIAVLPIRRFHGVGRVTEKRMLARGIVNGADLRQCSLEDLNSWFGKSGQYFYDIARGVDKRAVVPNRVRKSIGTETTLDEDCADKGEMVLVLDQLAQKVEALLSARNTSGLTLTLKVKFDDFQNVTRSLTHVEPIEDAATMLSLAEDMLARTEAGTRPVRLLGLTISNLTTEIPVAETTQMELPFT